MEDYFGVSRMLESYCDVVSDFSTQFLIYLQLLSVFIAGCLCFNMKKQGMKRKKIDDISIEQLSTYFWIFMYNFFTLDIVVGCLPFLLFSLFSTFFPTSSILSTRKEKNI